MMAQRTIFGGGGANALPNLRASAVATTSSLANGASDSSTEVELAPGYRLYSIQTSRAARVRLYQTDDARTADLSRPDSEDPADDAGVVLDYVTEDTDVHSLSPLVEGVSLEDPPASDIPMTVTNNGSTGTVVVTLVYIQTEAVAQ